MRKTDCIHIRGLQIFAHHGVFDTEKQEGQLFVIHITLFLDLTKAGETDCLADSVHYGEVSEQIKMSMTGASYDLLERAAQKTIEDILLRFPLIKAVRLELQKPNAPVELTFDTISVEMTRGWHKVYLSFGSNLGDKKAYIEQALEAIRMNRCFRNMKVSDILVTEPYGGVVQEEFLNGVLSVETFLEPCQLLRYLQSLESLAGRERRIHWGPRTLDLDILFYDQEIWEEEELQIPHPDLINRRFVLNPLMQLMPNLRHPVLGKTVKELAEELEQKIGTD